MAREPETEIYIGSDNRLTLTGVTIVADNGDETPGDGTGTCEYRIETLDGVVVEEGAVEASGTLTYSTTLLPDGATVGYVVTIDREVTLLLRRNQRYYLIVAFDQGGSEGEFELKLKAVRQ